MTDRELRELLERLDRLDTRYAGELRDLRGRLRELERDHRPPTTYRAVSRPWAGWRLLGLLTLAVLVGAGAAVAVAWAFAGELP